MLVNSARVFKASQEVAVNGLQRFQSVALETDSCAYRVLLVVHTLGEKYDEVLPDLPL